MDESSIMEYDPLQPLEDSTGFLFTEDYTLFGLLVLHKLCLPSDYLTLVMAQRREQTARPLLAVLADANNLTDKQKKDINDLIGVLSEPKLRGLLPANLPAVETIRMDLEATVRTVQAQAAKSMEEAVTIASVAPTVRSSTSVSVSALGTSYTSGEVSTRLTGDEVKRIESSKKKGRLVGEVIAGHVLIDKLGGGGQGDVYLAKQLSLNRYVAMKSLEAPKGASLESFIAFFRQEAETLGRINHARIVKVFEIFESDGRAFFTMEHITGKTVRELVVDAGGGLPLEVVSNLACQACSAFQRTSEDGLVHRDIKPANMLLDENGDLKIVDFGLAGTIEAFGKGGEFFAGTPHYASPEQAAKTALTPLSDQYSLGLTLYYALTGQSPVGGKSLTEVLYKQMNETPPPPSQLNNNVPKTVDRVVMRMLEKDPAKRYASFDECYTAWQDILLSSAAKGKLAGTSQLLGENLLRISRAEGKAIARNAITLGVVWVAFFFVAVFGEQYLREAGLQSVLKFCGDWGTYVLGFSLLCIAYVAAARRGKVPMYGDFRAWLYTHIATAVISIMMLLIHSGHFLRGLLPGGTGPKPVLSILSALALLVTAISGVTGLVLFRALQKRIAMEQLQLRGKQASEKEKMVVALGAQALSGWRLVHYPLAIFFVVLALLHILAAYRLTPG